MGYNGLTRNIHINTNYEGLQIFSVFLHRFSTFFLFGDEECGNESKQAPQATEGEDCEENTLPRSSLATLEASQAFKNSLKMENEDRRIYRVYFISLFSCYWYINSPEKGCFSVLESMLSEVCGFFDA